MRLKVLLKISFLFTLVATVGSSKAKEIPSAIEKKADALLEQFDQALDRITDKENLVQEPVPIEFLELEKIFEHFEEDSPEKGNNNNNNNGEPKETVVGKREAKVCACATPFSFTDDELKALKEKATNILDLDELAKHQREVLKMFNEKISSINEKLDALEKRKR